MKAYLNDDDYENEDDFRKEIQNEDEKRKRRIIIIIIIILIILLLITSCSCTSKFFGKIGDLFRNEGSFNVEDGTNDSEVIKNQELTFDTDYVEMSLSDVRTKISFTYKHINPNGFTCSTSDADIATCYVSNNYVIVIPKKVGEVTIYLRTTANGKTYEASTKAVIKDVNRSISLSSESGTINLAYSKYKDVPYTLIGLSGEVTVSSSDEKVATAIVKDGILSITGLKTGNVTITLTLQYNGMEYSAKYTLSVVNNISGSSSSTGTGKPSSPNTNPGNTDPGTTTPENPNNPSEPDTPKEPVYNLTITKPNPDIYYLNIHNSTNPYQIIYELTKDNVPLNEAVTITSDNPNVTFEIVTTPTGGKAIKVTPNSEVKPGDKATITISAHGKTISTTIEFAMFTHYLTIEPTSYDLYYTDTKGSKIFNIKTSGLFTKNMIVTPSADNSSLSICEEANNCVYVSVPDEYKPYIEIFYGEEDGDDFASNGTAKVTDSLPIRVVLKESALGMDLSTILPKLQVTASSYGEVLKVNNKDSEEVLINLHKGYKIILNANNATIKGYFSNEKDTYEIIAGEIVDLSEYLAYGIVENDDCKYYPIISYNTQPDGSGETYKLTDTLVTQDLILYAIYDTNPENIEVSITSKKIYLNDVYLFNNQAYFDKYGEYAKIYPGAQGSYVINLYNNSSNDIIIKGMNLEEDNICIKDKGCLNMGYIVKHTPLDANANYYYGNSNERYAILNQETNKTPNGANRYLTSKQIPFGTGIQIPKGKGIEISLLWKWVEGEDIYPNDKDKIKEYDEIDTAIGNYAAEKEIDSSINDLYNLTISIDFAEDYLWCHKSE